MATDKHRLSKSNGRITERSRFGWRERIYVQETLDLAQRTTRESGVSLHNEGPGVSLGARKPYEVAETTTEADGLVRIIDESGDDHVGAV
jgi:hypothetical protein